MSANLKGSSTIKSDIGGLISSPLEFYKLEENVKVFTNSKNGALKRVFRESQTIKISKF